MVNNAFQVVQNIQDAVDKFNTIARGGPDETIEFDDGTSVPSIRKSIADAYSEIQAMTDGVIPFETLADAVSAGEPPLDDNGYHHLVRVVNDASSDNNGIFYWSSDDSGFIKSPYDPISIMQSALARQGAALMKISAPAGAIMHLDFTSGVYMLNGNLYQIEDFIYDQYPSITTDGYSPQQGDALRLPSTEWMNNQSGTFVIEFSGDLPDNTAATLFSLRDSASGRRVEIAESRLYWTTESAGGSYDIDCNINIRNARNCTAVIGFNAGDPVVTVKTGRVKIGVDSYIPHDGVYDTATIGYSANDPNTTYATDVTIQKISFIPQTLLIDEMELASERVRSMGVSSAYGHDCVLDIDFKNRTALYYGAFRDLDDFVDSQYLTDDGLQPVSGKSCLETMSFINRHKDLSFIIEYQQTEESNWLGQGLIGAYGSGQDRLKVFVGGVETDSAPNIGITPIPGVTFQRAVFTLPDGGYPLGFLANNGAVSPADHVSVSASENFKPERFFDVFIGQVKSDELYSPGPITRLIAIPKALSAKEISDIGNYSDIGNIFMAGDSFASALFYKALKSELSADGYRMWFSDGVGGSSLLEQERRFWKNANVMRNCTLVHTDDMAQTSNTDASKDERINRLSRIALMTSGQFLWMEPGLPIGGVGFDNRVDRDGKWAAVVEAFPDNCVPVEADMIAASDGSQLDQEFIAAQLWPGSVLSDPGTGPGDVVDGHLSEKGNDVYAAAAARAIRERGW